MATAIDRVEVRRLLEQGAQLVEVLPEGDYENEHLPGAMNIPLKKLDVESVQRLRPNGPVIVYCYDFQWDLSPRAAARLESIGFEQVYDYSAGKADWGSFGLPIEGIRHSDTRVGAHARTDAPVCARADKLADVSGRVRAARWDTCFVTDERGVVLGRLDASALAREDDVTAEQAMAPGPRTVRPSFELDRALDRMRTLKLTNLPVTLPDGVIVGVIAREQVERALAAE
jgi:rhodanese-related sulfurtransferase